MPSGVSQGSALPAGSARAVFSNAIFAKFGMRLIPVASFVMAGLVPAIHVLSFAREKDVDARGRRQVYAVCATQTTMPGHDGTWFDGEYIIVGHKRHSTTLIMVRMLLADDAAKLVRSVVLQRGLARQ